MDAKRRERRWVLLFLAAWFCLNLLFLTRYPLVHSDESWLAGLTRNMMAQGSPGVTEPFFDLKPRAPHAIKILFHLLQMPFIRLAGYSVFSVRLLSLISGALALYFLYRCLREAASFRASLAVTALISVNGQFLSAAHTARQEILLLAALMLLMWMLVRSRGEVTPRLAARLALVTGLAVGLHPNSFLLAAGCGLSMLFLMGSKGRFRLKPLVVYALVTGGLALLFVGLSLAFDRDFPAHYLAYGDAEFGLAVPLSGKFREFIAYLGRLYRGESGTYVLPGLKAQLLLIPPLFILGVVRAVRSREPAPGAMLGMALGATAGTLLIGRLNQLSAILWMLPFLLLLGPLLTRARLRRTLALALASVFLVSAAFDVLPGLDKRYENYLAQIAEYAAPSDRTLANLNTGFYFENDALLDFRNLAYLRENGLSFPEYVESRGIRVILWPEEMDFIYENRPYFNAIYGNPRYVPEVEAFLAERCTLLGEFVNEDYAVRIVSELGKPYAVRAYRVNAEAAAP